MLSQKEVYSMESNYTVLARKYHSQDFKTLHVLHMHISLPEFVEQVKPVLRVFWPRH